ncbi:DUF6412 domain-containing protein [Nocardia mangyaensis]|uniref:DUF6412 domain-containing protein n=1 Tax=Nocardia mangyaensis TaxID=2213200 RepID=UPI0026763B2A|nr:DUF6412 domain-containing protein [Nocardia mangyaensis]MDO3648515.1 DUF6412 domain-containing protein [Nocardia mangyaensis]
MHSRAVVLAYAVLACVLPAFVLLTAPGGETARMLAFGAVAAAMVCALAAVTTRARVPVRVAVAGPPRSAQRRLRGSFLPQSNPDTAGRPRPRAPGIDHR